MQMCMRIEKARLGQVPQFNKNASWWSKTFFNPPKYIYIYMYTRREYCMLSIMCMASNEEVFPFDVACTGEI